ncbi:MAG: hypothetical protein KBG77_14620 [Dermatophilaceae bacterium]|nr:hypothetical protein [Dermatophilaceae bacterium]
MTCPTCVTLTRERDNARDLAAALEEELARRDGAQSDVRASRAPEAESGALTGRGVPEVCDVCTHLEIADVIAERDNLAAKVARVKALADQWRRTAAEPAALRALIEWALADREARTHDLQGETLIPTWVIRDRADALKETL